MSFCLSSWLGGAPDKTVILVLGRTYLQSSQEDGNLRQDFDVSPIRVVEPRGVEQYNLTTFHMKRLGEMNLGCTAGEAVANFEAGIGDSVDELVTQCMLIKQ